MKKETDIYSEARRRVLEPSQKGYTPKNCIAKTKQDCFYFQCIYNSHNGGECVRERELPADGIELRHKVKVERLDRTTFRDWPQIVEQTAKFIKQREIKQREIKQREIKQREIKQREIKQREGDK